MDSIIPLVTFLLGIAAGGGAVWFWSKDRIDRAGENGKRESETDLATLQERLTGRDASIDEMQVKLNSLQSGFDAASSETSSLKQEIARLQTSLEKERKQSQEKIELLEDAETRLSEKFKNLAGDALKSNNDSFLALAKTKFKPIEKSIEEFDDSVKKLEKDREGAYKGLRTQVEGLDEAQRKLNKETANLVGALRSPNVGGQWGEIQLRRVVELAGMLNHCDFHEQQSQETDGKGVRPDLVIQLAGKRNVVVDSKVSLSSYLEACDATDEITRTTKLADHAKSVRSHIRQLGQKAYFEHFDRSPEFVVLFIANEASYSAALEQDPSLLEEGPEKGVIIATPTTLIALLRTVAYGWREEQLAQNAKEISDLGKELYKRIATVGEHVGKLGKSLSGANDAYNKFVGSFETRVLVTARKFSELQADAHGVEIEPIEPIDSVPRKIQSHELKPKSFERIESKNIPIA
ncbi:MAG: DNA recombination protein RmuC [Planctomycetaceae bacterium]|nr:DNA recombination protein RmuC [Planctomycetaceae bacterium]MBT6154756.1 DNA recombination protein RmuC [Planctomycetaceae bacterium]MBT6485328.1 DNA recombination protein RmuC [Planctomycetaceae bacterium]MBT6496633.1 DNA recombination protein RmuC [Planctomycetaceae bacterium]